MATPQYRVPRKRDLAEDDWVTDSYRGRRKCPKHPEQDMIPVFGTDICPVGHWTSQTGTAQEVGQS